MTGESTPVGTIECDLISWGTNTFVTPGCGEFSWLTDTMTEYQLSEHFNQIIPPKLIIMGDCSPLTSAATSDCSDLWQALGDCPNHYIFGHFVRPGPTAAQKAYLAMMFLHFYDFPIIGNYVGCQLFNMCNQTQVDDFVGGRPEPLPGYHKRLEVNSFIQGNFTLLSNELFAVNTAIDTQLYGMGVDIISVNMTAGNAVWNTKLLDSRIARLETYFEGKTTAFGTALAQETINRTSAIADLSQFVQAHFGWTTANFTNVYSLIDGQRVFTATLAQNTASNQTLIFSRLDSLGAQFGDHQLQLTHTIDGLSALNQSTALRFQAADSRFFSIDSAIASANGRVDTETADRAFAIDQLSQVVQTHFGWTTANFTNVYSLIDGQRVFTATLAQNTASNQT